MRRSIERLVCWMAVAALLGCGAGPSPEAEEERAVITSEALASALKGQSPLPTSALVQGSATVDLRSIRLDSGAWTQLAGVEFDGVTTLMLGPPAIRAADVDALCRIDGLDRVVELVIDSGIDMGDGAETFGDAGAARVAACPALRGLQTLRLPNGTIGDVGLAAIAGAEWPALTTLDMDINEVGVKGVEALVASPLAAKLTTLRLARNALGDAGALALIRSGLPGRAVVAIGERGFSDAVAGAVMKLDRVERLSIANTLFSEEIKAALVAKFGDRIEFP